MKIGQGLVERRGRRRKKAGKGREQGRAAMAKGHGEIRMGLPQLCNGRRLRVRRESGPLA